VASAQLFASLPSVETNVRCAASAAPVMPSTVTAQAANTIAVDAGAASRMIFSQVCRFKRAAYRIWRLSAGLQVTKIYILPPRTSDRNASYRQATPTT
jgi:hypothetical protein